MRLQDSTFLKEWAFVFLFGVFFSFHFTLRLKLFHKFWPWPAYALKICQELSNICSSTTNRKPFYTSIHLELGKDLRLESKVENVLLRKLLLLLNAFEFSQLSTSSTLGNAISTYTHMRTKIAPVWAKHSWLPSQVDIIWDNAGGGGA